MKKKVFAKPSLRKSRNNSSLEIRLSESKEVLHKEKKKKEKKHASGSKQVTNRKKKNAFRRRRGHEGRSMTLTKKHAILLPKARKKRG